MELKKSPNQQEKAGEYSLDFPSAQVFPAHNMGFRTQAADFQVVEKPGFTPCGEGEHLYLKVRKIDENTRWIARQLAMAYNVQEQAVGYCGLKDRRAVTTQWFSVHLPGKTQTGDPVISGAEILQSARHSRKLKPGMHVGNSFVIVLRGSPDVAQDLEARLSTIANQGVPNYFGEQRFGREANNLREVAKIVSSPRPRFKGKRGGLYLSAARSWLFNQVLAERVTSGRWRTVEDGPLWGRGRSSANQSLAEEELAILAPWRDWCTVLEHSGLQQERRNLVLKPQDLSWQWQEGNLTLSFFLPPGTYATALLRELAQLVAPDRAAPG